MQRWLQRWCAWSVWQYSASQCTVVPRWPSSCSIRCSISGCFGLKPSKWFSWRSVHRWPVLVLWYYLWDAWRPVQRDTKCIERGDHVSVAVFRAQWYVSVHIVHCIVYTQKRSVGFFSQGIVHKFDCYTELCCLYQLCVPITFVHNALRRKNNSKLLCVYILIVCAQFFKFKTNRYD